MDQKVQAFLLTDRQWLREQRIAHARYQLSSARSDEDKAFWTAVLEANNQARS